MMPEKKEVQKKELSRALDSKNNVMSNILLELMLLTKR